MRPRSWTGWSEVVVTAGLSAVLVYSVLYSVGDSAIPALLAEADRRGHSPGRVSVSPLALVLAVWVGGWNFVGPLAVSQSRLLWLVWRKEPSAWLRQEKIRAAVVAAFLAGLVAMAVGSASAATGSRPVAHALGVWITLVVVVLGLVHLQRRDLDGVGRSASTTFGAAGAVLVIAEAWGYPAAGIVGCGLVAAVLLRPPGRPRRPSSGGELTPRWQLHRGAQNRWAIDAGITLMDGEIVRMVRHRGTDVARRLLPAPVYRTRWPANVSAVLLARGVRTVALTVGLVLPVVLAVNVIVGPGPATVVAILAEYSVIVAMTRAAATWRSSRALPRLWAHDGRTTSIALMAPGLATCLVVAFVVCVAVPLPALVRVVLVALPAAALLRRMSVRNATAEITLVATPAGAVPVEVLNRVIAGPDVVLISLLTVSWLM